MFSIIKITLFLYFKLIQTWAYLHYVFENNFNVNMLIFNNLPTLDTLVINCVDEEHNQYESLYFPSYFIINWRHAHV